MSLYLDASIVLPTLVEEAASDAAQRFLTRPGEAMVVTEFAAAEIASAISRLTRTQRLSREQGSAALADFDAWRMSRTISLEIHALDLRLASALVRRFELMLRAPDALHLAICSRHDLTLATFDRRLEVAAGLTSVRVAAI